MLLICVQHARLKARVDSPHCCQSGAVAQHGRDAIDDRHGSEAKEGALCCEESVLPTCEEIPACNRPLDELLRVVVPLDGKMQRVVDVPL